jgi:hypothetical protein
MLLGDFEGKFQAAWTPPVTANLGAKNFAFEGFWGNIFIPICAVAHYIIFTYKIITIFFIVPYYTKTFNAIIL